MRAILQKILLLIAILIVTGISIHAGESNITDKWDFGSPTVSKQTIQKDNYYTNSEQLVLMENNLQYMKITAGLYAFSLIIITLLILIKRKDCQAKDIVTIIGLVSVIFGIILLVLVVDTNEALTAPMGILGAIAGYLFGTAQKREGSKES